MLKYSTVNVPGNKETGGFAKLHIYKLLREQIINPFYTYVKQYYTCVCFNRLCCRKKTF